MIKQKGLMTHRTATRRANYVLAALGAMLGATIGGAIVYFVTGFCWKMR